MRHPRDSIPEGHYCYSIVSIDEKTAGIRIKHCPFYKKVYGKPIQMNGYCGLLKRGDWQTAKGIGMLWDEVKECGINKKEDLDSII